MDYKQLRVSACCNAALDYSLEISDPNKYRPVCTRCGHMVYVVITKEGTNE